MNTASHPLRLLIIVAFFVALFAGWKKAGHTEIAHLAAEQTALYTQERAIAPVTSGRTMTLTTPPFPPQAIALANFSSEVAPPTVVPPASTPSVVRGVYLTGFSAGSERVVNRILSLVDTTEINAVIIDIKDATGRISYQPRDPSLQALGSGTNHISDLSSLIARLHEKGIYVIGRVSVFQDPFYADRFPGEAFVDTRTGALWRDYKGISWLRPDSRLVWDYTMAIARDAHAQGFDEINLDYIRFPSDGPLSFLQKVSTEGTRSDIIESFFAYIGPLFKQEGVRLSVDLFGLTMSASDDLGIGQKLERIAPYVDVVAPMVYPSHFAPGSYGIAHPAEAPAEIITHSLSQGKQKLEAAGLDPAMLRPWLQDFNLGAVYTAGMVREQIDASETLGLPSWMLWDPANTYTTSALLPE
ncbi:GTP-binding protein [Candidatus Nomurabacteria bacterium]|nr:GTP-binding protein [Candidatus Nomurabacteria bacterium]